MQPQFSTSSSPRKSDRCTLQAAQSVMARAARPAVAGLLALALQFLPNAAAMAEPWKKVGNWILAGSTELGGCTLATRYSSGAFLSFTTIAATDGHQKWEILVSDIAWATIREGLAYPVDVLFLGSAAEPFSHEMHGFKTFGANSIVTNALVAEFPDTSDFSEFIANGMRSGSDIAFVSGGRLLGSFSLDGAKAAYPELLECFEAYATKSSA